MFHLNLCLTPLAQHQSHFLVFIPLQFWATASIILPPNAELSAIRYKHDYITCDVLVSHSGYYESCAMWSRAVTAVILCQQRNRFIWKVDQFFSIYAASHTRRHPPLSIVLLTSLIANIRFCISSFQQSDTHKFHHEIVAQCFYFYCTQILHVSAIYICQRQGVTSSIDVRGVFDNLSQTTGRLHRYIL